MGSSRFKAGKVHYTKLERSGLTCDNTMKENQSLSTNSFYRLTSKHQICEIGDLFQTQDKNHYKCNKMN
jgi:hypothetical protein